MYMVMKIISIALKELKMPLFVGFYSKRYEMPSQNASLSKKYDDLYDLSGFRSTSGKQWNYCFDKMMYMIMEIISIALKEPNMPLFCGILFKALWNALSFPPKVHVNDQ